MDDEQYPRTQWPQPYDGSTAKKTPPAIQKLILELGLRYRPLGANDQDAYRQQVALLAGDCAEVPPDILARAIERYVRIPGSNFLPRANQLIEIAKSCASPNHAPGSRLVDRYNAMRTRPDEVVWRERPDGSVYLDHLKPSEPAKPLESYKHVYANRPTYRGGDA